MKFNNFKLYRNGYAKSKILLTMKLTAIFLFTFLTSVGATSFGQRITLTEKNTTLEKALIAIGDQSGYDVLYNSAKIKKARVFNINIRDITLQEALNKCFVDQPFSYSIESGSIVVRDKGSSSLLPQAAKLDVRGRVIDETNNGLPGATVKVKGTTIAVVTDNDGKFSLKNVNDDAILQVSFVSYVTQEVKLNGRSDLLVQLLAESGSLEEVVVSAYGQTQKKISVTASISTIQTRELKQSPVANLSNALAGRLPGLTTIQSQAIPGADAAAIYIRGIGTYGANRTPLIVIDGLPRGDANFGDIDVNEVASISILKDAAATSLYGIQGANGVVLVTTKRGTVGKTKISFNANYGVQTPGRLPAKFNSLERATLDNIGAANDGLAPVWTAREIELFTNKQDPYTYPDVDWYNELFKEYTPQQQYNTNISGGNENVKYFVSLGYLNQGSLFKSADDNKYGIKQLYDRYNFRSNIDIKATEMLNLRLDLASRLENRVGPGPGYASIFTWVNLMQAYQTPIYNPDGSWGAGRITAADLRNPVAALKESGYYNNSFNSTNGTIEATHKLDFITKGLSAKGLYSFENYSAINNSYGQTYTSYRYRKDPVTGVETYGTPFTTETSLTNSYSPAATRYFVMNLQLDYNRDFGKSNVKGLVLFTRNLNSRAQYLPSVYEGYLGRLGYSYDNKYFVDFNIGYNGSENFPKGQRYGVFPAVSAGWIASSEPWFKSKVMNLLKFKGSFGYVGNDKINNDPMVVADRWLFITDYARNAGGFTFGTVSTGVASYVSSRNGNPNITWEKSQNINLGVETGFFNNQLRLDVEFFRNDRKDILTSSLTIPTYLGITNTPKINVGRVVNKGLEASLNYNTNINALNLFGYLNWTYNKNKILERDEPDLTFPYQSLTNLPIGYQLGYQAIGLVKDQAEINAAPPQSVAGAPRPGDLRYADINGDGFVNVNDRIPLQVGNFPNHVLGLSLGVGYKGFDLSFLLQSNLKGTAFISYLGPNRLNDFWTPETASTATYPIVHQSAVSAQNNSPINTWFIYSTDYLKLKNVELGYTLPQALLKKMKLNNLRFFANGLNLFIWDKLPYQDFDPEQSVNGTAVYPIQKVYNLGLTLTF